MAEETGKKTEDQGMLIDPIYEKFVRGVTRAIGSTEFYQYFMDAISRAQNEFQFSNRKLVKTVDLTWVNIIEETLEAMQSIVASPRNVIKEEELIVNVANAKRATSETVRHLAQHASLVENFDEGRGEVRPSHLMQRYREDSIGLYENRLVFTTMEYAYHFVKVRHDALFEAMSDEFGAKLKLKSDMDSATEHVHMDMYLHIKEIDSALLTDKKNGDVFDRISRIYRVLGVFMSSQFAQQMAKLPRIKGSISKTNVLKKNKNYRDMLRLFEFLRKYDDVGYTIRVVEQNPVITEKFQQDIYRNILFQYLILKGYLQDADDRAVPTPAKGRRRSLKPKIIHQIVEELTEDYDLPDVEIRKVLIEELTKEQLMQEEAAERRRLVEEQARRKKEEEERLKAEKKAEQERIKAEKAAERERIRQEKEAERRRLEQERMMREAEDRRLTALYRAELERFAEELPEQLALRAKQKELGEVAILDFADAAALVEEAEERKRQEAERERVRRREAREAEARAQAEAEERARQEALAEEERARIAREAEAARIAEAQRQEALGRLTNVTEELTFFERSLRRQLSERREYTAALHRREAQHRAALEARRAKQEKTSV